MQIAVLVEPIDGRGFRALGAEPLALSAEGATRDEALQRLSEQLHDRLRHGAEIIALDVPAEHPLAKFAGMFASDPGIAEWKDSMAEYRRKVDEADDVP